MKNSNHNPKDEQTWDSFHVIDKELTIVCLFTLKTLEMCLGISQIEACMKNELVS